MHLTLFGEGLCFGDDLRNVTDHVEGDFWQVIVFSGHDGVETGNGVLQGHQLAQVTREHLGDLERLRQETLHLTGAGDGQLVLLRQLVHTQDGDDILK